MTKRLCVDFNIHNLDCSAAFRKFATEAAEQWSFNQLSLSRRVLFSDLHFDSSQGPIGPGTSIGDVQVVSASCTQMISFLGYQVFKGS